MALLVALAAANAPGSAALTGGAPAVRATVLYDGSAGTHPDAQGWAYADTSFGGAARALGGGASTLDTLAFDQIHAGYSASAGGYLGSTAPVPILNRTVGYTITFAVQVEQEHHSASSADKDNDGIADRAGFSVTAIGSDERGIELGFWQDRVWAQEGGAQEPPGGKLFTHAEGAVFDTTGVTTYTLAVAGDAYRLAAGGAPILSSRLRDYTAFDSPLQPSPYRTPSFIFFGDGTASASARIRLFYAAVTAGTAPPTYVPFMVR